MHALGFAARAAQLSSQVLGPLAALDISNAVVAPDGFERAAIVVNGQTPAPLISGTKGDRFSIQVTDHLQNESMQVYTSIHWHGIDQGHANWDDGVSMVTQCPLVPGESFEYSFATDQQAGTYWYHSHWSTQYCDGLRGPLVIYDPDDPQQHLYDIDDETTVITVSDWNHVSPSMQPLYGYIHYSDATLINGVGRYINGPLVDLAIISVQPGKRYRFRLISMSCEPAYTFSIDGHNMTIIEADGNSVEPLLVDSIQILAAQRYSFVLEASQPVDNYWIRAIPNFGNCGQDITGGVNAAILRYAGASNEEPTTLGSPSVNPLSEKNLHALINPAAPGEPFPGGADLALTMQAGATVPDLVYSINDISWTIPAVPVLLQVLSGAHTLEELLPKGSVYMLPANKTIELTMIPPTVFAGDPHPLHLHGMPFSVVRSAGSTEWNFENPVRRDVVSIGLNGTSGVTIRFTTDNPGPWFLHCHIDYHLATGFAAIMAVDVGQTFQDIAPIPMEWYSLCPAYDLATGKNAFNSN